MLTSKQPSQASRCRVTGLGRSLLFISQCFLAGAVSAETYTPQLFSFEGYGVPGYVQAPDSSSLTTNTMQFIHGEQSLVWSWGVAEEQITLKPENPITVISDEDARPVLGRPATHVLSFWVYNKQPIEKSKTLKVLVNGKINTSVEVSLDFTGWRTFGASISNDLNFDGVINSLVFQAPDVASGSLLIDRVMFSIDDNRYQWGDDHIKLEIDKNDPREKIDFGVGNNPPQGSTPEYNGLAQIKARVVEFLKDGSSPGFSTLKSSYDQLGIKVTGEGVTGRHVITDKQQVIYQSEDLNSTDKASFDKYVILGDSDDAGNKTAGYAKLMLDIARAYHQPDASGDKEMLREMYINMTRHLLNQGFYAGSALVTTHHWGYSGRWWYLSALLMAESLGDDALLNEVYNALVWYSREFKESFDMVYTPESSNLDYFNTLSIQHLVLLLLEPDDDRRVALVKKYSDFISQSIATTPAGYFDGFRPDGTVWRHKGNYPGYSFAAMDNVAKVIYFLSDTEFKISPDARNTLKKAMTAGWVYTNPIVGLGNSGRHPFTDLGIKKYAEGMSYLARSTAAVDEELAAIYLQVTGKTEEDSEAIFGKRITPAALPEGHWSYNGGAFGIHRYQDIMVTLKAYNSNVWSSEIYAKDNRYGRYQSHGGVQIMPYGDPVPMGYQEGGWDWNRNPGTTTIRYSDFDELESPNSGTLMVFSEEAFSGSASLNNEFGLFAFKHKEHNRPPSFDPTFVARKSVLAIGNRLIMLGSDISNTDSGDNRTETTLFQHTITPDSNSIWVKGEEVTKESYSAELGEHDWLIDGMGNGYLIGSNSRVEVRRQQQSSRHNKTKVDTTGHVASAWIDHGNMPDKEGYEYQVILKATPDQMSALAANLRQGDAGYKVLRQDNLFHIIQDQDSGVTGYVAFERGETKVADTLITYIDQPALAMVRTLDNGRLTLTAVSPGLNISDESSAHKPVDVTVTLNGVWELSESAYQGVQLRKLSDTTEVTFTSDFGQSSSIELKPEGDEPVDPTPPPVDPTPPPVNPPPSDSGSDGGGSLEWMALLILLMALFLNKKPATE